MKWEDLFGWEDYYKISEDGEVVRKRRIIEVINGESCYQRELPERKLTPFVNGSGYTQLKIRANKVDSIIYIHVAVYESFNKIKRLDGYDINHIDHDKRNNNLKNLEMITHKENMQRASDFYYSKGLIKKQRYKEVFCDSCGIKIHSGSEMCRSCNNKRRIGDDKNRKVKTKDRPTKEKLYELLTSNSFVAVGKIYGVTDNTIRKWCKGCDIPYKASYYKNIKKITIL